MTIPQPAASSPSGTGVEMCSLLGGPQCLASLTSDSISKMTLDKQVRVSHFIQRFFSYSFPFLFHSFPLHYFSSFYVCLQLIFISSPLHQGSSLDCVLSLFIAPRGEKALLVVVMESGLLTRIFQRHP